MKYTILITFIFLIQNLIAQVSIYEIQYTTNSGYDSPYAGQLVETGGIVTGSNYDDDRFFLANSDGGAWNGIFVYDNYYTPTIGDSIVLSAYVYEYSGLTELKDIQTFQLVSSGNELPAAVNVTTSQINSEQYEGVLVKVSDIEVSSEYNEWSTWEVNDGSGDCIINPGFFDLEESGFSVIEGYPIESITGIVSFNYGYFHLNPRNIDDFVGDNAGYIISIQNQLFFEDTEISVPVLISFPGNSQEIDSYSLSISYDSDFLTFESYTTAGTLSDGGLLTQEISDATVHFVYDGFFDFSDSQALINLNFNVNQGGNAEIEIQNAEINNTNIEFLSSGEITIVDNLEPIGDTLTVIQRPILNVPEIVVPEEIMQIVCDAPQNTTDWNATLIFDNNTLDLQVISNVFDSEMQLWTLEVRIPEPEIYELYDLQVTASDDIFDITQNAVRLIPEEKDSYYFIQISDTHLPTHFFYADNPQLVVTDTSEMEDLRAVIRDINLLNPEFVLFTGDLVNEGELEDFLNARVYTKAQRVLSEFEVPVYLVSGNHDLGGWVDTPPEQGTARRDWWRFFGWKWLQNPPASNPVYTQDYTFEYGNAKYIGIEAYDNYDSYMYDIYGAESFTYNQINWLNNELENSDKDLNILFYHYDFSGQINLNALGADMALYGHIHSDAGSIWSPPYNLAVDNVCDGTNAYRVVKVEDNVLLPQQTTYTGEGGNNVKVDYYPSNEGLADSVSATLTNQHTIDFEHSQVKFVMPKSEKDYTVTNGTLLQIDKSGIFDIYYVGVNLSANSEETVSLSPTSIPEGIDQINPEIDFKVYPNPFENELYIKLTDLQGAKAEISIYDLNGRKVKTTELVSENIFIWNTAGDNVRSGVYFIELICGNHILRKKVLKK